MQLFESDENNLICAVTMAARHLACLSVKQYNLSLCCFLHLCQILARRLISATGFLAASVILVLATIVSDRPIDHDVAQAMRYLQGYPYSKRAAIGLAGPAPEFQTPNFPRRP